MAPASVRGSACAVALALLSAPSRPPVHTTLASSAENVKATIDSTLRRDDAGCATVRSTVWHPLSGLDYTGRLRIHLPARAHAGIVLFVGDDVPLDLEAETIDGHPVGVHRERLPSGPGVLVPPDYWLDDGAPWNAPPLITRVTIDALPHRDLDVRLGLGRRAPRVLTRLAGYPSDVHAAVCADRLGDAEIYYATGWYGEEPDEAAPVRWMGEHGAVLLTSADGGGVHIVLDAAPAAPPSDEQPTRLRLRVNGVFDAPAVSMRPGPGRYEWDVPDRAWVPGTNELFFTVSRTLTRGTRTMGLALTSLTVR
jgi:hypothetical protein